MRADRLISILLLLQVNGRMTAHDLAQRLEVSERTIHRDMDALSASGIPVVAERGTNGGWSLLDKYRTDLTGLSQAEIQSLFVSKPPRMLADLGLREAAENALIKLLAALPLVYRRDAEFVRQRIHIDGVGWQRSKEDITFLPQLQEAIWLERKLHLTYLRNDDTTVERLVDPLGLVAKGNAWYMVAGVDGELRTYRISRVKAAVISDRPSVRPDNFDLAAYWDESSALFRANLPRYPAILCALPDMVERMRYSGRYARIESVEQESPEADGRVKIHILFETDWEACQYVLSFGAQVEVLEPDELRQNVIRAAKEVVRFYCGNEGRA